MLLVSRLLFLWIVACFLTACVTPVIPAKNCPSDRQALPNCPPFEAVNDPALNEWYELRTFTAAADWERDPIKMGVEAEIPVQDARIKLLGSSDRDALYSLAAKIYMIEQAEHSVDAVYYIFTDDLVGRAFLGALCNAVKRGVDVRLLVDSLGTVGMDKNWFRALYHCQLEAGFIRNEAGELSTQRARVQVVIFNAVSRIFVNMNRRSHDKMIVVDGFVPEKAMLITGGRNISLSYYGINADGTPNPDTYMDAELLLRPSEKDIEGPTVSHVAEIYFTMLNGFKNNKHIQGRVPLGRHNAFPRRQSKMQAALASLKSLPAFADSMAAMPEYLNSGYRHGEVRLAHEFANLVNKRVVKDAIANLKNNPNSIMGLLTEAGKDDDEHIRIVSPYLFAARYYGPDGEVLLEEAQNVKDWLDADPERIYEIVTNSVLTSDNFFAQSVVDMDMAPRLLFDEQYTELWLGSREEGELNPELVDSATWLELVNHPQLRIYETGRLDDRMIGGDHDYGKLHAKYSVSEANGFLGTSNFDYRSRLYNNEMGFFFRSDELTDDIIEDFELLKSKSLRWGSPQWLEMRQRVVELGGVKGWTTKHQGSLFRFLRATGLKWYF